MFNCHSDNFHQANSKKVSWAECTLNTVSYYDQLAAQEEDSIWPDACLNNNAGLLLNLIKHEIALLFNYQWGFSFGLDNEQGQTQLHYCFFVTAEMLQMTFCDIGWLTGWWRCKRDWVELKFFRVVCAASTEVTSGLKVAAGWRNRFGWALGSSVEISAVELHYRHWTLCVTAVVERLYQKYAVFVLLVLAGYS